MLVTVNKAKVFTTGNIDNFSLNPGHGGTPCIRWSLHHEKHHARFRVRLLSPLLFSLKHIACHFSHMKFQIGINILRKTFIHLNVPSVCLN